MASYRFRTGLDLNNYKDYLLLVLVRWCYACNMSIIPWVECLLAIRFACGVPRLYRFFYPIPFRSVSVCGFLFVFFVLFVFRISVFLKYVILGFFIRSAARAFSLGVCVRR